MLYTAAVPNYACINCGHEHPIRAADGLCESCGRTQVIDLEAPQPREVTLALRAGKGPLWLRAVDIWVALAGVAIVAAVVAMYCLFAAREGYVEFTAEPGVLGEAENSKWPRALLEYFMTIRAQSGSLASCLDIRREHDSFSFRWTIEPDGRVIDAHVKAMNANETAASCLAAAVSLWQFRPPPAPVPVRVEWSVGTYGNEGQRRLRPLNGYRSSLK